MDGEGGLFLGGRHPIGVYVLGFYIYSLVSLTYWPIESGIACFFAAYVHIILSFDPSEPINNKVQ